MAHRKSDHTSRIVCKHWLRANCRRDAKECWYRHSNLIPSFSSEAVQSVPSEQDFPDALPPHQPPAQRPQAPQQPHPQGRAWSQMPTRGQSQIQEMLTQMAMRMNTLELGISESRSQMHTLQQMFSQSHI